MRKSVPDEPTPTPVSLAGVGADAAGQGASPDAELAGRLEDATSELSRLRSQVRRLEEENRAFLLSMRHMTVAAEAVLTEAREEAAETRERAAAEAYEKLVVARADARAALHDERNRLASELEMLAAVREKIEEERAALTQFHEQMSGSLRGLVHAMLDFADRTPELEPGPSDINAIEASVANVDAENNTATETATDTDRPLHATDPIGAHDARLEQAFADFFGGDDAEPSRGWILNEP